MLVPVQYLGMHPPTLSTLDALFTAMDRNQDGKLTRSEFNAMAVAAAADNCMLRSALLPQVSEGAIAMARRAVEVTEASRRRATEVAAQGELVSLTLPGALDMSMSGVGMPALYGSRSAIPYSQAAHMSTPYPRVVPDAVWQDFDRESTSFTLASTTSSRPYVYSTPSSTSPTMQRRISVPSGVHVVGSPPKGLGARSVTIRPFPVTYPAQGIATASRAAASPTAKFVAYPRPSFVGTSARRRL